MNQSRDMIFVSTLPLLGALLLSGLAHKSWSKKPSVELHASATTVTIPCSQGASLSRSCPQLAPLDLKTIISGFGKQSAYFYTVTGGKVIGEGDKVNWDLSWVPPGFYKATVEVQDDKKHRASASVTVTLGNCGDCVILDFPCPTLIVTCYDEVKAGTPITCKVDVGQSTDSNATPDRIKYEWSVHNWAGDDLSARVSGGGKSISIRTEGLDRQHIRARIELKGVDPSCSRTAEASTLVKP